MTGWNGKTGTLLVLAMWASVAVCWPCPAAETGEGLRVAADKETVSIFVGDRPVLVYQSVPSKFKSYVRALYTPGGVQVLRDSPADHIHHHALMFALGVDGRTFWDEHPQRKPGSQAPRGEVRTASGRRGALEVVSLEQQLDWIDSDKQPALEETRRIEVYRGEGLGATLLTWRSRLAPAKGKDSATLTGAHYYGLGMRFVESMDKTGAFFNAAGEEGEKVRGTEKLLRAAWCAYAAPADGKVVTAALFDHPDNPRRPAWWFTMNGPFAYLSATLNLHREPMPLAAGRPLELCYGVALWDGKASAEQVDKLYKTWCGLTSRQDDARPATDTAPTDRKQ